MQASFEVIVAAIKANNNKVVDDHRCSSGELTLTGVAQVKRNGTPVALCDSKYFSLNRLYMGADGKPHVSREAVAGVVEKFDLTLQEAIDKYNDNQHKHNDGYFALSNVTLF